MGDVTKLPLSDNYKPEQALNVALEDSPTLEKVLILGQTEDGFYIVNSKMSVSEALWLLKKADKYVSGLI